MSGATGAAGGATGGQPGAAQGGTPYGGVPPRPAEHPAGSTSVMPQMSAGQPGGQGGFSAPPPPPQPPAQPPAPPSVPPPAASGAAGFSQPTTYAKGQPTPPRGTRTNQGTVGAQGAARRPGNAPAAGPASRMRKARLRVTKADPWSVMKVSFLLSLAVGVIIIVATAVLWMTLDGLGVFSSLTSTLKDVTGSGSDSSSASASAFNLMDYIGFGPVMTFAVVIAVVDVVLMTALSTLSAFIYNTAAGFTGGIELTLAEED